MVLPRTFVDLPMDQAKLPDYYAAATIQKGEPASLEDWGQLVETAVDWTVYNTSRVESSDPPKGLPKTFRGRCQPREAKMSQFQGLVRSGRPGDYHPPMEVHSFATLRKIKQVRRLQSVVRMLALPLSESRIRTIKGDWKAIIASKAFGMPFANWALTWPEVSCIPLTWPQLDIACTLFQLAKFETDRAMHRDRQIWLDKLAYRAQVDHKLKGDSGAFKKLREDVQPRLQFDKTVEQEALFVPGDDQLIQAFVPAPSEYSCSEHCQVGSVSCQVVGQFSHHLVLRPVTLLQDCPPDGPLVQQQHIFQEQDIMQELHTFWDGFWKAPVDSSQESAIHELLHYLPEQVLPVQVQMDLIEDWEFAIATLKPDSSRGIDAISAKELKCLPQLAVRHLAKICVDLSHGFPAWMMVAKTSPVPKNKVSLTPAFVRPITTLAQVYRVWSRVAARKILRCLAAFLPPPLYGFLPGRSAVDCTMTQQWLLELSFHTRVARSGFSLDLLKCFNTIARHGPFVILRHLGLDPRLLTQWQKSLDRLCRYWSCRDQVSQVRPTSVGFPEGDPLSVVAMLCLGFLWVNMAQTDTEHVSLFTFADNWSWSASLPQEHETVFEHTQLLTKITNMQVDWRKCWQWATHPDHASQLSDIVAKVAGQGVVPRTQTAMELGSQLTYQGSPKLGKLRNRMDAALHRVQKLQALVAPLEVKTHLVLSSIYPMFFFGAEITPIGFTHLDKLRTKVVDAVLGPSQSRNPAIAMQVTPGLVDPVIAILRHVLAAIRRFLVRQTPAVREQFFFRVAQHSGEHHQCKGPAGTLKYYLGKLDWGFDPQGFILVNGFIKLHLLDSSRRHLYRWIQQTWDSTVFSEHTTRKGLQHLSPILAKETQQLIQDQPVPRRKLLINEISGAFQTRSQQSSWDHTCEATCEFCPAQDTREHRLHECPATFEQRLRYQPLFDWMHFEGVPWHEMPALLEAPNRQFAQTLHYHQSDADLPDDLWRQLQALTMQGHPLRFFTDGSCQFPQSTSTRFASCAAVVDIATNEQRIAACEIFRSSGRLPTTLVPVLMQMVPGEQDINRAELLVIVRLCELFSNTEIVSDSQTSLDAVTRVLTCQDIYELVDLDNFDLLIRLKASIHVGTRTFSKIKAHQEDLTGLTLMQIWHVMGNKMANDLAIWACWNLQPMLVALHKEMNADLQQRRDNLRQLYEYLHEAGVHRAQLRAATDREPPPEVEGAQPGMTVQQRVSTYQVEQPWVFAASGQILSRHCAWGPYIAGRLVEWLKLCHWPTSEGAAPDQHLGVTHVELSLSFMLFLGCYLPLKRTDQSGVERLVPLFTHADTTAYGVKLGELGRQFSHLMRQLEELSVEPVMPDISRSLVRSLYDQGSNIRSSGFTWRPRFFAQDRVAAVLHTYLQHNKGPTYAMVPTLDFSAQPCSQELLLQDLRGTWASKARHFGHGTQLVRRLRKDPSFRPLSFDAA
eukprot:Skav226741  [mRNA]  locus=scaffold5056:48468:52856:- [translate_table: standard]